MEVAFLLLILMDGKCGEVLDIQNVLDLQWGYVLTDPIEIDNILSPERI